MTSFHLLKWLKNIKQENGVLSSRNCLKINKLKYISLFIKPSPSPMWFALWMQHHLMFLETFCSLVDVADQITICWAVKLTPRWRSTSLSSIGEGSSAKLHVPSVVTNNNYKLSPSNKSNQCNHPFPTAFPWSPWLTLMKK